MTHSANSSLVKPACHIPTSPYPIDEEQFCQVPCLPPSPSCTDLIEHARSKRFSKPVGLEDLVTTASTLLSSKDTAVVVILGSRKSGKTSLIQAIAHTLAEEGHSCINNLLLYRDPCENRGRQHRNPRLAQLKAGTVVVVDGVFGGALYNMIQKTHNQGVKFIISTVLTSNIDSCCKNLAESGIGFAEIRMSDFPIDPFSLIHIATNLSKEYAEFYQCVYDEKALQKACEVARSPKWLSKQDGGSIEKLIRLLNFSGASKRGGIVTEQVIRESVRLLRTSAGLPTDIPSYIC